MRHEARTTLFLLATTTVLLGGCTSGPARLNAVAPLSSKAVDPSVDNAAVLAQLEPALVASLQISGADVAVADALIVRVPKLPPRRTEGDLIIVEGVAADGRSSTRVAVPDQRLNAYEGAGLVRLTEVQIPFALPLTEPIERVRVRLPESPAPSVLDVSQVFAAYCREQRADPLCVHQKDAAGDDSHRPQ